MREPNVGRARYALALHEVLAPLVMIAALAGVLLPNQAHSLRALVPEMLAGQVLGVAMTVAARDLVSQRKHLRYLLLSLVLQCAGLPLVGYALLRVSHGDLAGKGAFITSVAPAEITSALVAVVAGADAATGAAMMTLSVALSCVVSPLWLILLEGRTGNASGLSLVAELVLSVGLPLGAGVAIRERWPRMATHPRRWLDLAGVSLLGVVFVGGGSARPLLLSGRITEALLFVAVLIVAGMALGSIAFALGRRSPSVALGAAFPVGMREFGIATALALAVAPNAAGFGGLYGILMMLSATLLASAIRRAMPPRRPM